MRKIIFFLFGASLSMVLFSSCIKELPQSEIIKEITIDTAININSSYQLDLSAYCDSVHKATIIEQAMHYNISQIDIAEGSNAPLYTYSSSLQETGNDRVTLSISDLDDGKRVVSKDSTIIYINLSIR